MRRVCRRMACVILMALLLCINVSAADIAAWGSVQEQDKTVILCLPGVEDGSFTCHVGQTAAEITSATPISKLDTPVETVVLLDNSFSIAKSERPVIKEFLSDLIANRMSGEKYTIATISKDVNYICNGESDYEKLKSIVSGIEFQDQYTELSDGLYEVLDSLQKSDNGTLRRIVMIADGVDNKQVGYTQTELAALIKKTGYPIYAVGCTNSSSNATDELQNLFAISRQTAGATFYLPEVQKTTDIVSGVTAWNKSVQLKVSLPPEVCDGMDKTIRITSADENVYLTELKMPFAEYTPPEPDDPEPPPPVFVEVEKDINWLPLIIGIVVVLLVVAIVGLVIFLIQRDKKKKAFKKITKEESDEAGTSETEIVSDVPDDKTDIIFDGGSTRKLVIQDMDSANRRFEVPLQGVVIIGRDSKVCQVVLNEPSISRQQCQIFQQGGLVLVRNISEANITKLNGQNVTEDREITSGCTLQMGRLHLRIEVV